MTHALEAAARSLASAGRRVLGEDDPNETSLPAQVPLLLLPVRLETRFVGAEDGGSDSASLYRSARPQLLLRVYPDTINTSSFEPELTTDEIAAGQDYWQARWGTDADTGPGPWTTLANRFGAPRAAWIAAAMTPTNLGDHEFGAELSVARPLRASSYEKAPTAQALPDRWTVVLRRGTTSRTVEGSAITPGLAVGFTPHDGQLPDGLPVDVGNALAGRLRRGRTGRNGHSHPACGGRRDRLRSDPGVRRA